MCMITAVPASIRLPETGIRNGSYTNDDGHGWAIASSDGIQIGKSMDFDTAWASLVEARKDHTERSIVMFHSRFATHGTVDDYNVHPFWADEYTAVAHNGILPQEWHPSKKDPRSDTQILVDHTVPNYLSEHSGVPSRKAGRRLGSIIGAGNKLTILSVASGVPKMRIINAHMGEHSEGVWYSNTGYKDTPWWSGRYRSYLPLSGGAGTEYEDTTCDVCRSHGMIRMETGICDICYVCSPCYYDERWCTCPWNQPKMLEEADEMISETLNPEFVDPETGWVLG